MTARPIEDALDYVCLVLASDARKLADDLAVHLQSEPDHQRRAVLSRMRTVLIDFAVGISHIEAAMRSNR